MECVYIIMNNAHVFGTYTLHLLQFLCEAVVRYLDTPAPKLRPSIPSPALNSLPTETTPSRPRLEVTEVTSALFLLGELWEVEMDTVRRYFVSSLFAAGLGDRGTEVLYMQLIMPVGENVRDFCCVATIRESDFLHVYTIFA